MMRASRLSDCNLFHLTIFILVDIMRMKENARILLTPCFFIKPQTINNLQHVIFNLLYLFYYLQLILETPNLITPSPQLSF